MRYVCSSLLALMFFHVSASADWAVDAQAPLASPARWALVGGTGLTLLVLATDHTVGQPFERRTAQQKPLGKYSKYGDIAGQLVPNAMYAGGMGIAALLGSSTALARAEMMVMATGYASLVTTTLKYTVREGRPYNSKERNSFPSGHTTTAFAFAGVVAAEHGWWYGVPAMAMATFVGYSRLNDHAHYLHDVVAGATVGLSCSLGIYYARQDIKESPNSMRIIPTPIPGGAEMAATWTF